MKTGEVKSGRKEFDRLQDAIADGNISAVWIDDRSRLMRESIQWLYFKQEYLLKYKVDLYEGRIGKKWDLDNEDESGLADILQIVQSMENQKRARKSVRGTLHRNRVAKEQNYTAYDGGTIIFGFKVAKTKEGAKKLVKDVEEAKLVKWIFDNYEKGKSIKDICIHLTKIGVAPRRSKVWNTATILNMLHNKNYTGLYKKTFKSRVSEIDEFSYKIDRIITLAQYNRIQKLFSKENLTNAKSHFSLLGDFLVCECGAKFVSHQKSYAKRGNLTRKYECSSKNRVWKYANKKSECINYKSLNMDKANSFVINYVKEIVKDLIFLKKDLKLML